jgi:hypothetical protein
MIRFRFVIHKIFFFVQTAYSIAFIIVALCPKLGHADPKVLPQPKCVQPDLNNFLEQSRTAIGFIGTYYPSPSAIFLTFQLDGHTFQWMAASWFGPDDGALLVLDCKGHRVAALHLGRFDELKPGPAIPGFGKTIEVVYIVMEGTGWLTKDVSLIAFSGKSIVLLWDHEASYLFSDPTAERPVDYIDQYSWRYSESGTIIHVSGKRRVGEVKDPDHGWPPHTTHDLPGETFCWQASQRHYISCKGDWR